VEQPVIYQQFGRARLTWLRRPDAVRPDRYEIILHPLHPGFVGYLVVRQSVCEIRARRVRRHLSGRTCRNRRSLSEIDADTSHRNITELFSRMMKLHGRYRPPMH
jgi:hypothetical protein